jgi:hypothetical protein
MNAAFRCQEHPLRPVRRYLTVIAFRQSASGSFTEREGGRMSWLPRGTTGKMPDGRNRVVRPRVMSCKRRFTAGVPGGKTWG